MVTELLAIDKGAGAPGGGYSKDTVLDWVKVTYPDDVKSCSEVTFTNGTGNAVSLLAIVDY